MHDPSDLHDEVNWLGGFYELAVELGPPDDGRLHQAVSDLRRILQMAPGHIDVRSLLEGAHLRGVARLASFGNVVSGIVVCRYDGSQQSEEPRDWIALYFPLGALAGADSRVGAFPFDDESGKASLRWRRDIDDWLVEVAKNLYAKVPFLLALVGLETLGESSAAVLVSGVPAERWYGYILPERDGIAYHPATH